MYYKIRKLLIAALFILVILLNRTQAQNLLWTQTYGGPGQDGGESMVLTNSGGIVIAGFKSTNSLKDILIMKTDALGNEIWSRTYNLGLNDIGRSLRQTQDGGFIIAGMTEVNPQTFDPFLIKTDSAGIIQWQRQYDYGLGDDDRVHSVWTTSDGGFIIAGQTWLGFPFGSYDFYVVKTDMLGNFQWQRTYAYDSTASPGADVALSIQQLSDGGYIIGGFTQGNFWASYIIRTDSLGNAIWSNIYPGSWQSECYDIQATPDGGFILTGTETSFETDGDLLIIKLNANGNLIWKKIYGTEDAELGESIKQLPDGGYIIAGMSTHGAGGYDMYVVRTNSTGDSLWSRTIGGSGDDRAFAVASPQAGSYLVTGWTWSFGQGLGDVYLLKLLDTPLGMNKDNKIPASMTLYQNYPNPFNPVTVLKYSVSKVSHVRLVIYDISGREVTVLSDKILQPGTYESSWDAAGYSSGVYFYKLEAEVLNGSEEKFIETKKMLLMK